MTGLALIVAAGIVAKAAGAPFMKKFKWAYFLIIPILYVMIRGIFKATSWLWSIVFFFIAVDVFIFAVDHLTPWGGGTWPLYTGKILAAIFNGIFG